MNELKIHFSRYSFYVILGFIIVSTVITVMAFHSAHNYQTLKNGMIAEMQENARLRVASLQKNVATMMAAYAVNEYETLLKTQMDDQDNYAIIVHDYNMGKIVGKESYQTGQIRNEEWASVDFNPENPDHVQGLTNAFYSESHAILAPGGGKLGTITVYLSDRSLNEEFKRLIKNTLINALIISLFLILLLFVTIRLFVLKPLSDIVAIIDSGDANGIPLKPVPGEGSKEIFTLADKMNRMINAIRDSQGALKEQHEYLQAIINGVDDSIMVIDEDYTIQLMNNAARKMIEEGEISDPFRPRCYEVAHHRSTPCEGNDHACPLKLVMETGHHKVVVHSHDIHGEKRYVEISATPLFDKEGDCIGIIEASRDITAHLKVQEELREQQKALEHQANHDALTGLANRTLFDDRLEQGIAKAQRNGTKLALLFIDLDHFKEINDSLGHKVGDKALKIVTQRLSQTLRKGDTLARLGGDEFSVIIEDLKEPQDASLLAEKILRLLAEPMSIDNHVFYSGCSIGISLYPDNGDLPEDLLKYADAAMYNAKNEGRNNFQYYTSEMTERALERVMMETKLREGLKNNEFVVFYQPQVDGRSGSLCGMEALVRWQSPELGLVSPAKFIPIAESTGLIVELDRHVMRTAMTQIARWYAAGFNPGVLAMNLAVKQLHQKDFFDFLEALINETGCKAEWLELEVTEGQIMIHPDEAIKILTRLSAIGVNLAIDDFGTGYSSLSYLKKFPINKLKIDRSFIKDLPEDEEDAAITRAIIALSRNLNLSIIAEGVETTEQHTFLIDNGCAHIQGYFYSKPLPTDEMEVALSRTFG